MMTENKAKGLNIKKRVISSKLTVVVGIFLLAFISVSLAKEIVRRYEVDREIKKLETQIAQLEERNTALTSLITFFNTDAFLEQEARTRLNLQKPGEQVVVIPDVKLAPNEEQKKNVELSLSNPSKWWNYFFKTSH